MKLGVREGVLYDEQRPDWDAAGPRPVRWSLWYPATDDARECDIKERSWFRKAAVARDAPIRPSNRPYPLVLLSHGTGGSAAGLEWLARRLVDRGFVALGVDHHGNTGSEPYRAEGFACLWERASDLSFMLDRSGDWLSDLASRIDADRVFAAGFSAGAYSVMLLLGAVTQFSQFEPSRLKPGGPRGPREFPDLADHIPSLLRTSGVFRQSWSRMSRPYRDDRIAAALLCAPGRSVLGFDEESLKTVEAPALILVGDADKAAPAEECSSWLHQRLTRSALKIFGGGLGHYVFVPEGTGLGFAFAAELFTDPPGIERAAVHDEIAELSVALFRSADVGARA
ncbi:dienelactone hydrolase [Rhizobium lentis]|uniref:alpha/beta hydrolase family protein n=1 Tax=Rhizobium lentis TaxID=1138194 RepID=UPI001C82A49E|nr:dienelactone hydrolase [Rhizobium lentis]MBX5083806.1 dienelactone hydrolase [Rhizobium lentis]MBX5097082.1 dienelactone hydrolase [Rhizobium lentis]MBX5102221.1 dienelactone hydrolase [Rhizobium lentis]MBX5121034.1 dienelactone hydrolase [Rhizobium lentis]MBX5127010.1 dienelactone hydrolase [Rhizobium lentis]